MAYQRKPNQWNEIQISANTVREDLTALIQPSSNQYVGTLYHSDSVAVFEWMDGSTATWIQVPYGNYVWIERPAVAGYPTKTVMVSPTSLADDPGMIEVA